MDKLAEKIGLYDIWATAFPGAFFLILLKSIYKFMVSISSISFDSDKFMENILLVLQVDLYVPSTVYELLVLCFGAYIVGMFLQEIASLQIKSQAEINEL